GGAFCAGYDLKVTASGYRGHRVETGDGPMGPTRLKLGKPVIAAIEGHAVAGGLELALWCDLRVARPHRNVRRLLPALRRSPDGSGHGPPAAPDRPKSGAGFDPDWPRRIGR